MKNSRLQGQRAARTALFACVAALLGVSLVPADEIVLRDGRKITGTVVGIENGMFRVETDFGVALVRKDKVARIEMATPAAGDKASPAGSALPVAPAARPTPTSARSAPVIQERRPPDGRLREHVEGTTYINESFGFEMFKPPTWRILESTVRSIPSAVAAIGTVDESTMLVVGSVLFDGPPAAYAAVLDTSLKRLFSDFARGAEEETVVAGHPAVRRAFQGVADGQEWHGLAVNLTDGKAHYGIIGLTREETYQFKSSVIAKVIGSFRFR